MKIKVPIYLLIKDKTFVHKLIGLGHISFNDVIVVDQDDPTTFQEAMNGPDSEKWLEAMKEEIQSVYDNQI